jgi:hypothetical protein
MKARGFGVRSRSPGLLVLLVVVAGVLGSVLSHFLGGVFPVGPVRDFFFKSLSIGVPTFTADLGFASLTFGLAFSITSFSVILVGLAVYIWYKF